MPGRNAILINCRKSAETRLSDGLRENGPRRLFASILMASALLLFSGQSSLADELRPSLMGYLYGPASDVTGRLGAPKSTEHLANGDTVLNYEWSRSETEGGYTVSNAGPLYPTGLPGGMPYGGSPLGTARIYIPMQTVELPCKARFVVGTDGQVREISWDGNGCFTD